MTRFCLDFFFRMSEIFDENFLSDKRVSRVSGKMFNKYQRAYINQFSQEQQLEYFNALDRGTIGEFPEKIPTNLL